MRQPRHQTKPEIATVQPRQAVAKRLVSSQIKPDISQPIQAKPMFRGLSQELSLSAQGEGEKLPEAVQQKMEAALNANFSDVRIHEGNQAREVGAIAYTQGSHIHFAPGRYDPLSLIGQSLLGHELAHVLQQRQGIVKPMVEVQGRSINNDPALEHEADVLGQKAATMPVSAQSPLSQPQITAVQPSNVIQCVGGVKFGIKPNEDLENLRETAGYKALKAIVDQYDEEIRLKKQRAKDAFKGKEKDSQAQDQYSETLFQAEKNIDELRKRIGKDKEIVLAKDQKTILDTKTSSVIAELVEGSNAYTLFREVGKDTAEPGQVQNIYKKHKLEGVSNTEYVESGGRKLRRYANRGITPAEKAQIKGNGDVKPVYFTDEERQQNQTGVHYPENDAPFTRKATKPYRGREQGTGDLDFLHNVSGVKKTLTKVPLASRPFLQERKGVNKEFSATATAKPITSNHGSGFGTFGAVTLDLSKVQPTDILHHYANTGEARMESGVPEEFIEDKEAMVQEEKRAGLTAIRNREIHLNKYPASAIVGGIQDSSGVKQYKQAFDAAYESAYEAAYGRAFDTAYEESYNTESHRVKQKGNAFVKLNNRDKLYKIKIESNKFTYRDNGVGQPAGEKDGTQDGTQDGTAQGTTDGRSRGIIDGQKDDLLKKPSQPQKPQKAQPSTPGNGKKKKNNKKK